MAQATRHVVATFTPTFTNYSQKFIMLHTKVKPQADGFAMLIINQRLMLCYKALKKPGKGGRMDRLQCGYFGFDSPEAAQRFANYVKHQYSAPRLVIRESDRLVDCAFEVKVWEFDRLIPLVYECVNAIQKSAQAA